MLGKRLYAGQWTLRPYSHLDTRALVGAASTLCDIIGMTPAGEPVVWEYPVEGKGGVGVTLIQPIVESFLYFDFWPEVPVLYAGIKSCKVYDPAAVGRWLYVWLGEIQDCKLHVTGCDRPLMGLREVEAFGWQQETVTG